MRIGKAALGTGLLMAVAAAVFLGRRAAGFLVIDAPERSDVIVVLAGDYNDRRLRRGLELLAAGEGKTLLVDANSDVIFFGRSVASQEADYLRRLSGLSTDRARVCAIAVESTYAEASAVRPCLEERHAKTALLVTSDYHTRRALSIFSKRLPQYRWSVAAAKDEAVFEDNWWRRRPWAKTTLLEWTKLVWWYAVDRWRCK